MRRFESSRPSQAVRLSDRLPSKCERSPRKAGFHTIDSRLYKPKHLTPPKSHQRRCLGDPDPAIRQIV